MTPALRDYLARAARRGFDWRAFHCGLLAADWVLAATGRDPAEGLRDLSLREMAALKKEEGGFLPLFSRLAFATGLAWRSTAQPGDVGVILAGRRQTGAIRTGKGWAVLTPGGYAVARLPSLSVWAVL